MVLSTATIESLILRPDLATDFAVEVTINAVAANALVKETATGNLIGGVIRYTTDDTGLLSVPDLPLLPQAGIEPANSRWRATFRVVALNSRWRGAVPVDRPPPTIEFELSANTTWGALVDVSEVPITLSLLEIISDLAAAAASSAASAATSEVNAAASAAGAAAAALQVQREVLPYTQTGALVVRTGVSRMPIDTGTYTITSVRASVNTASAGASIIVDVNKNGTTIYGTQANRPTIAAGAYAAVGGASSVTTVTAGDYLTVDVDQVGSPGTEGQSLTVIVRLTRLS